MCRFLVGMLLVAVGVCSASAQDFRRPDDKRADDDKNLRDAQLAAIEAWKRSEELRKEIVETTLLLTRMQQVEAKGEREKLEIDRKKIEQQVLLKKWALASFEAAERKQLPPGPDLSPPDLKAEWARRREMLSAGIHPREIWEHESSVRARIDAKAAQRLRNTQKQHQLWKQIFLTDFEKSKSKIRSGEALNFFLAQVGGIAAQHENFRRELLIAEADLKEAEKELVAEEMKLADESMKIPPPSKEMLDEAAKALKIRCDHLATRQDDWKVRTEILSAVKGATWPYDQAKHHREHMRFQTGAGTTKVVVDVGGLTPLEWPRILLQDEYTEHRDKYQAAEKLVREALESGKPPEYSMTLDLMESADRIAKQFELKRHFILGQIRGTPGVTRVGFTPDDYLAATRFLAAMRARVGRLVVAKKSTDLAPTTDMRAQSIHELLAFLSNSGLHFAPAQTADHETYEFLYREMVDYYTGLYRLHLTITDDNQAVAKLAEADKELFQKQYRDLVAESKKLLDASKPDVDLVELVHGPRKTLLEVLLEGVSREIVQQAFDRWFGKAKPGGSFDEYLDDFMELIRDDPKAAQALIELLPEPMKSEVQKLYDRYRERIGMPAGGIRRR